MEDFMMQDTEGVYPALSTATVGQRESLPPPTSGAFQGFTRIVFAEGAVSAKAKQLIAVAVAHSMKCPYCIRSHSLSALRHGAKPAEIMEAIWIADEMLAAAVDMHPGMAPNAVARETVPPSG
jgi:AhpD family alkylhydroperoxidase